MPRFNSAKDAAIWGDGGQDAPALTIAPPFPEPAQPLYAPGDATSAVLSTLNQIQMLAETLAETNLDPMQQELVQFLVDAGMTLRREVLGADSAGEREELELDDLAEMLMPRLPNQDYLDFDLGDEIYFQDRQRLHLLTNPIAPPRIEAPRPPPMEDDLIVEDVGAEPQAGAAPETPAAGPLHQLRLLIADDNSAHQSAARLLLEDLGAICSVTSIGEAADLVRMGAWDAILIDVQIPARAGLAAMRTIRADEISLGKYRTPIFGFLQYASPDQIRECLNAGADASLPKPLTKAAAVQQLEVLSIERSLERRSA